MKEIVIYPDPQNTNTQKGDFFEKLIKSILIQQRFKIKERINFTGMEIDLICEHMDRKESAYVECKACDSLESSQIGNFIFKVDHQKVDYGFFVYSKNFQHQVGGLIAKCEKEERYKHISFWNGEKVIELLVSNGDVKEINTDFKDYTNTKTILLYSYVGTYYISILSQSTIPQYFSVCEAKTLKAVEDINLIKKIQAMVKELTILEFVKNLNENPNSNKLKSEIETVAEIQESEAWDDYKPASSKFFQGRDKIKNDILDFLEKVVEKKTSKRIFYIDGKSGWGKSSLVNELKGRSRNKFYKSKYFVFAVDSRSANSENFVALSFKKIIEKASKSEFIDFNVKKLKIMTSYDVLGDRSVKVLCDELMKKKRLLVIIFDQFEDIFRKGNLFKVFYKFLYDLRDARTNIVLGFSWKSEINVPIDHEAYHLWQQAREYADCFSITEFNSKESLGIIKQLEKAIKQKLDLDFRRKIIDNSQGFPWLVKKLCIHIFKQYRNGFSINTLLEQDFNVELLFKDDLEGLSKPELNALNYIAKRSFGNNAFDTIEIDEKISEDVLSSLINKRLAIKSGTKYNIYWDIFRDYLVLNEIPKIGETYLIRLRVQSVLDTYLLFKENPSLTSQEIASLMTFQVEEGSLLNNLRELRSIGLLKMQDDKFEIKHSDIEISEDAFKAYLFDKLKNHTLYIEICKINARNIELNDIAHLIKNFFKTISYSDKTLETYARVFINWVKYAGLKIPPLAPNLNVETQIQNTFTPQFTPEEDVNYFLIINDGQQYSKDNKTYKILYDLKSIGLLQYSKGQVFLTSIGKEIKQINDDRQIRHKICSEAIKTDKIKHAYEFIAGSPTIGKKDFQIAIKGLLIGINSKVYQYTSSNNLYRWGKFVHQYQ